MNTNYILGLIGALILFFASCERADETIDIQPINNIFGAWQVSAYVDDVPVSGAFQIDILKSASQGADSVSITEKGFDFWNFSVNAAHSIVKGSFSTDLSVCQKSEDETIGIKIDNGKVIGTDSLYLEMKFEDDILPFGTTYQLKGHRLN